MDRSRFSGIPRFLSHRHDRCPSGGLLAGAGAAVRAGAAVHDRLPADGVVFLPGGLCAVGGDRGFEGAAHEEGAHRRAGAGALRAWGR